MNNCRDDSWHGRHVAMCDTCMTLLGVGPIARILVTVHKHHAAFLPHDQKTSLANQLQATAHQLHIDCQAASGKLLRSQEQTGPDVLSLAKLSLSLSRHVLLRQVTASVLC